MVGDTDSGQAEIGDRDPGRPGTDDAGTTVGILGAGHLGMALASRLLGTGYVVRLATRRPASVTAEQIAPFLPGVTAVSRAEAYDSDIVIAAIPLRRYRSLPAEALRGRVVVDVMNHLPLVDGPLPEFDDDPRSTSEIVQAHLAGAHLVRTLNHISAREISTDSRPAGEEGRRALAIASDHPAAAARVGRLVDAMGFDPVEVGPLATARVFAPGTPIFHGRWTAVELRQAVAEAVSQATPAA
ncbi:NADPH-dependent F420 reductase [Raineyella sp. LH-20]|uniref:NADPH-dependent F420 reductase n=1 Tax=Raineyella sp. LH-20 TaxID=3081204 RepID=UPI002953400A|nr:NAD(P)-binding domain-containing protein [Raineyella sp. LH-20]WOP20188.1 NAD(P)-binding domain-containing protein [Raineyella sp. LH-20]